MFSFFLSHFFMITVNNPYLLKVIRRVTFPLTLTNSKKNLNTFPFIFLHACWRGLQQTCWKVGKVLGRAQRKKNKFPSTRPNISPDQNSGRTVNGSLHAKQKQAHKFVQTTRAATTFFRRVFLQLTLVTCRGEWKLFFAPPPIHPVESWTQLTVMVGWLYSS